jgi:hypothetical protein
MAEGAACRVVAEGKAILPRMNADERGCELWRGRLADRPALSDQPASAFIRVHLRKKFLLAC